MVSREVIRTTLLVSGLAGSCHVAAGPLGDSPGHATEPIFRIG
jgi:hypothetical protein